MRIVTIVALAVAIGLATAVSPFASASPDGLEKVARDEAFVAQSRPAPVQASAPAPGYAFPGVDDPRLATALAGFAGTLLVFALGAGAVAVIRRPRAA
jgi:PDGLE domain